MLSPETLFRMFTLISFSRCRFSPVVFFACCTDSSDSCLLFVLAIIQSG
jgi:hypothetical protein